MFGCINAGYIADHGCVSEHTLLPHFVPLQVQPSPQKVTPPGQYHPQQRSGRVARVEKRGPHESRLMATFHPSSAPISSTYPSYPFSTLSNPPLSYLSHAPLPYSPTPYPRPPASLLLMYSS